MMRGRPGAALVPLRALFVAGTTVGSSDGQLLERFAARQGNDAEAAFAALVARHGPIVRRACRALLADAHDAEDVFQATFFVLARKAGTIRTPELLGNWLYGTAHRTARKLKVRSARRLKREANEAAMAEAQVSTDADAIERQAVRREEAQLVHEEIARLPEVCRAAVVLCDLEGQSHEEAARRLCCSDRTVRRRLARARDLLRARLTRRGLAPTATAGLLTAILRPEPASAAVSQFTVDAVARAATRFAVGQMAASTNSTLAEGVIMAMFWTKLKGIAIASSVLLAIGIGTGATLGFIAPANDKKVESKSGAREVLKRNEPNPAEQYRALVKNYDDAMAAHSKLRETAKTEAERREIDKNHLAPEQQFNLRFLALAQRYPDVPAAVDALVWIIEKIKMKGEFAGSLKKSPKDGDYDETLVREFHGPEYLKQLRAADPGPILSEADQLFARVFDEYGEIAFTPPYAQRTRETLADVVRRERRPGRAADLDVQFRAMDYAFHVAVKAANQAEAEAKKKAGKAEPNEASVRAYIAAYPKWADCGLKMWRLAQDSPRNNEAFEALIWLVEQGPRFFDAPADRDAIMSQVVDALIRDHLETIAEHLTDRNVVMALNVSNELPTPYRERLLLALFERGRDRPTRGRMGLALGRYLKAEADCVERLTRPGADSRRPWDLYFLAPALVDQLRKADRGLIEHKAEEILGRVIVDYGDFLYVDNIAATKETLAAVAEPELSEIRSLSVGKKALEIDGKDVDGQPMRLSEFRGKVVLLDFGSHEHCGGCKLVYPRLRSTLDRVHGRPFVILGINNHDDRDALKQAIADGEITWRCWYDGEKPGGPGPITTSWNIRGYPTFFLIDHRGVIRSKDDIHPFDTPSFDNAIETLLKEAEGPGH
jgi:RNA polymerase sigma factor (sigma-70 family)